MNLFGEKVHIAKQKRLHCIAIVKSPFPGYECFVEMRYRILSFKCPGRLYFFFDFGVGIYWRGVFIQKT